MTAYTILRFAKLKSWGAVGAAGSHNSRIRETTNADPEALAKNRYIIGSPSDDLTALAQARLKGQKIRRNAVYAIEGVMSASPAYFRPDHPERYGHYDLTRLKAWTDASMIWLRKKYGDRVISAVLHMDEATPHLQFVILPLDDRGRLNCRKLFGGNRQVMVDLQTEYAQAVAHLGISRGRAGSKAQHQDVAQYYAATQNLNHTPVLAVSAPADIEVPEPPGAIARFKNQNLTDYARETAAKAVEGQTARLAPLLQELTKRNDLLTAEVRRLKAENDSIKDTLVRLNRTNATFKAEAKKMRDIPLDMVLIKMFGATEAQNSSHQVRCFELPDGSTISYSGNQWEELSRGVRGKGAINLVMHLSGYGQEHYQQAVRDMSDNFGEQNTIASLTHHMAEAAPRVYRAMSKGEFQLPPASEQHWPALRDQLTDELRIPDWLIDAAHKRGLIYSDRRQNCVFLCVNGAGAFVLNLLGTPFTRNLGAQSGPYALPGPDLIAYVTDTPLNALALKALHPSSTVLATGHHLPPEKLQPWLDNRAEIFMAQACDRFGQEYAQSLVREYPQAKRILPDSRRSWLETWQAQAALQLGPENGRDAPHTLEPDRRPGMGM